MLLDKIKNKVLNRSLPVSKARHVVALDIGTENVKALVGKIKGDEIEIVGVGRSKQQLTDMQSGAISDISGVVDNCDKALNKAETMAGVEARDVIVGIAGELVKGVTATIKFKRKDASTPISIEEMERIIGLVQARAEKNARSLLALESGNEDIEVRLVNSALVSIEIDSYKVSNPVGFQGKDVAIQLYTAHAPMIHIGAIERVINELDLDLVAVAAEPFAVARSMIGTDTNSNLSAILVDVGGGTTDIAVVNDGGVEGTKMFGIGGRAFSRKIATELDVDFQDAEEIKLELSKPGGVSDKHSKRIAKARKATGKTLEVWHKGVELALSDFGVDQLPSKILLCGGGSSLKSLSEGLANYQWGSGIPFTKAPQVHHIDPAQVVGIIDKTDSIHDHTFITAMGLLRVGLDTIDDDPESQDSIRGKLNRLLSI